MEYIKYKIVWGPKGERHLEMEVACTQCHCSLKGDENFCPSCGSKLRHIPLKITEKSILGILNEMVREGKIKVEKKPLGNRGTADLSKSIKEDSPLASGVYAGDIEVGSGSITAPRPLTREAPIICIRGKKEEESASCPYLASNGACTAEILTSIPPKYPICPFRGSGYVECKRTSVTQP